MAPKFLEQPCEDEVLLDLWHPLGAVETMPRNRTWKDQLLGVPLTLGKSSEGRLAVWRRQDGDPEPPAWPAEGPPASTLPVIERYGYLWTSLGTPRPLFGIPEANESNRRLLHAISVTAHTNTGSAIWW